MNAARLVREGVGVGAEAAVEAAVVPPPGAELGRADQAFEAEPGFAQRVPSAAFSAWVAASIRCTGVVSNK